MGRHSIRLAVMLSMGAFALSCSDDTTDQCAGITCPAGQTCNPANGRCQGSGGDGRVIDLSQSVEGTTVEDRYIPVDVLIPDSAPPSCTDGMKNADETDIDCGGATCPKCGNGKTCVADLDCVSGTCDPTAKTCSAASCTDTIKNGAETDVDCGGGVCPTCAIGKSCLVGTDCVTSSCNTSKVCAAPTCTDGVKNGTETDVDCGGTCPKCAAAKACLVGTDCLSGACDPTSKTCVAGNCTDGIKNGTETDIDCGGSCAGCATGKICAIATDCLSGVCNGTSKTCTAPTCTDTVKNGTETDVDCGGTCPKCVLGKKCLVAADCVTGLCDPTTKTCQAAPCTDGIKNGLETDIDCGGGVCPACVGTQSCLVNSDCDGKVCLATKKCGYAPSCAELLVHYGQTTDGEYLIQPPGFTKLKVRCDMTTDGGGWTLVGKGREGWLWMNTGQGTTADVLAHTTNTVAYFPTTLVRAIAGNVSWDNWANGLRVVRGSGVNDKWFLTPKKATAVPFAWSLLSDSSKGCGSVVADHTLANMKQTGGAALVGQAELKDSYLGLGNNTCNRIFTPAWTSHNCVGGFSTGSGCKPSAACWTFSTETHCLPHSTVWVKNCPLCPHIYYDSAVAASYPGTGNTWFDIAGNASKVNATIDSTCLTRTSLGNVQTFRFPGTACSRAQFQNASLNPQAFTAIYWVYSQNPVGNTNQGGLYVNRDDNTPNSENWVWFGKWDVNSWYFRVNDGDPATPCCQQLAGSGTANFSTHIPINSWRMVHFGYQTLTTNGWKWGVNGTTAYVGTLPVRPYTQSEPISTIGYGHETSGAYWLGGIGSVRIYNRLLTDAEILAEYNRLKGSYGL